MGVTQFTTRQLGANSVNKDDIDIVTTGKAVTTKIIAGTNIALSETGVDSGTGEVTISVSNVDTTNIAFSQPHAILTSDNGGYGTEIYNNTTTKKFLTQTGNNIVPSAAFFAVITDADIPSTLTGKTLNTSTDSYFNGVTIGLGGGQINNNTVIGAGTLATNSAGVHNTVMGKDALATSNNDYNVAVGSNAARYIAGGTGRNTAIGTYALYAFNSTNLSENTIMGYSAGFSALTFQQSVMLGNEAGYTLTNSDRNVLIGYRALYNATNTTFNTIIGASTGLGITTGSNNTIIGAQVSGLSSSLAGNIILATGAGTIRAQHDGTSWTLGTIGSGTWNGTVIGSTYGGTGVNNAGRTLTINTNSGTISFTTSVTLTVAATASISGTNTGDQTITLTGGDVTTSAMTSGSYAATIANNAVTLAKFQQIATASFLGRVTAATGNVEVLTATQATALLNQFTSSLQGLVPGSGGGTTNFLRADGTWATPPSSGGGLTWTVITTSQLAAIDNGYVTNSASLVTVTLPTTSAVGKQVSVSGYGTGGWKIAQSVSQLIHFSDLNTTTGTGGYLASTERYDAVNLVCVVANTEWVVVNAIGNITIV